VRNVPLPPRQSAQLIRTVADAVSFAHERGLLHRDLKPSNVLLDQLGVPHITDFGLAKRSDGEADLTLTGQILGSPNYMAPEQAEPNLAPTTAASDVYALGAMLYHLLTGYPPFHAETVAQTLRMVVEDQPTSPKTRCRDVPRDLETICLKCLEKTPDLRYSSARVLVDELDRFLQDKPIRARPISRVTQLARWLRRKPALASSVGSAVALLLVVCIGSPIAILRIRGERELNATARKKEAAFRLRAERGESKARGQLYSALLQQAEASVRSGEIGQRLRSLEAVRQAAAISNSVELKRAAVSALALPDLSFERELPTGSEFTLELMSPGFDRVALCRGTGPVEIRAVADWSLRATLPASTNFPAYMGCWSLDQKYLVIKRDLIAGGFRADVEVWDLTKPKRTMVLHDVVSHAISFHPFEHRLIAAQADSGVTLFDLEKCEPSTRLQLAGTTLNLAFAPDAARFAAVIESEAGSIVSVHESDKGAVQVSHAFADSVSGIAWHPAGRWLAIADHGGMVHLMDTRSGEVRALGSHKAQAATVMFSPPGDYLFSGGWEGELICWDMCTMQRSFTIGRQSWVVQFTQNGKECAIFTPSGIQLYYFLRPNPRGFAEDPGPLLRHAAFSPDGRWVAASAERYLGVWDYSSDGPGALIKTEDEGRPAFSADSTELFASVGPGNCSRWRLVPGTNAACPPQLHPVGVPVLDELVSLSASSNVLALTGTGGSALIRWQDLGAAKPRWTQTEEGINGISPDCQWLGIYRPFSPFLSVYHLPDLNAVATLENRAYIADFAFSPIGSEVAISSRSGVEFWNTSTWTRTRLLTNFVGILFSPGSSNLWLTSDFRTAGLYESTTLEPLLPLPPGTLPLALSPDGRRLAVSVNGRHLQVWDLDDATDQLRRLGLGWPATPLSSDRKTSQ
jgi:WD40 repeat protein